jgi:hypothetical protein
MGNNSREIIMDYNSPEIKKLHNQISLIINEAKLPPSEVGKALMFVIVDFILAVNTNNLGHEYSWSIHSDKFKISSTTILEPIKSNDIIN